MADFMKFYPVVNFLHSWGGFSYYVDCSFGIQYTCIYNIFEKKFRSANFNCRVLIDIKRPEKDVKVVVKKKSLLMVYNIFVL